MTRCAGTHPKTGTPCLRDAAEGSTLCGSPHRGCMRRDMIARGEVVPGGPKRVPSIAPCTINVGASVATFAYGSVTATEEVASRPLTCAAPADLREVIDMEGARLDAADSDPLPGVIAGLAGPFPDVTFIAEVVGPECFGGEDYPDPAPVSPGPGADQASLFDAATLLPPPSIRQSALGQYFTPPWLAAEVAANAHVHGVTVLEPSAGSGNIVAALLDAGAAKVVAVEIDPVMAERLRTRFANRPVQVICADFLSIPLAEFDHIDRIAGNPPYNDGMDSDHLARIADIIVRSESLPRPRTWPLEASLLVRTVVLHSKDRAARVWSRLSVRELIACEDRIAFEIDGKTGAAGKIDVAIMRLGWRLPGEHEAIRTIRAPSAAASEAA